MRHQSAALSPFEPAFLSMLATDIVPWRPYSAPELSVPAEEIHDF